MVRCKMATDCLCSTLLTFVLYHRVGASNEGKQVIKTVIAVGGVALALAWLVAGYAPVVPTPQTSSAIAPAPAPPVATPAGNGVAEVTLKRATDGHFYADAMVNGASVRFIVDTGATRVALTPADAQAVGLQFSNGDFTATGRGAGGDIALKPVALDRIALGPVEATQVDGVIAREGLHMSLLGQSFLSRVGTVTIKGDTMVLR